MDSKALVLNSGHVAVNALATPLPMYPLRFAPIFQYRLWGGRRLADVFSAPLPLDGPVGEAWLLSDRDEHASRVADGPLEGRALRELLEASPEQMLGADARRFRRFPLLLKFLDAQQMLSVQVHPSDAHTDLLPAGGSGKTEAWVVLQAGNESLIYAGLKQGTTPDSLRQAIADDNVVDALGHFTPKAGDAVFLPAGTVHSLGRDVVVFEIQQNSDVTVRLYDWKHVDAKTGVPRALQVDDALSCIDFAKGPVEPVTPVADAANPGRERLFHCEQFTLWRIRTKRPFAVGVAGAARVLVPIDGAGSVDHAGASYPAARGDVLLLPAALGVCTFRPKGTVTLLEIALPEAHAHERSPAAEHQS